jgi:predicted metal-dependent hydrolase
MTDDERSRLMAEGRTAFNRGDFFGAHELWETVWRSAAGPERRWLQGLIQVAAGLHQLACGRTAPAATLLARAAAKLVDAPETLHGVDLASVRREAARLIAALAAGSPVDPSSVKIPLGQ